MPTAATTPLLSVDETATILRVSRATTYRLIDRGELHAVRVGAHLRIAPAELRQYIYGSDADTRSEAA